MSSLNNQKLITVFKELLQLRVRQGQQWKAKAYSKAVETLQSLDYNLESGAQAKNLKGFGASLCAKIDEILTTGTCQELETTLSSSDSEREQVLDLFCSVERVGQVTATRWYDLGYRKLEDIPPGSLTTAQRIGIELRSDLQVRIPRVEIDTFERRLKQWLRGTGIQFCIAGSYRRGAMDSGDIDVLVVTHEKYDVMDEVLACKMFTHTLAKGRKKYLGVGVIDTLHRRIDIEVVTPEEYPFTLLYFTGSGKHNILMREHVSITSKGKWRLNEKGIYEGRYKIKECASLKSERDIFEFVGMDYLEPNERERGK